LQDRDRPRGWVRTLRQGRRRQPQNGGLRRRRARHGAEGGRAGPDDEPAPMKDLFDLTDRIAVVTGGSRGLGREMGLGVARAGAVVMGSGKVESCQALARQVEAETGRRALAHACHVGRWQDLDRLADAAYQTFGKVDVLVNNAGMSPLYDQVVNVTEDLYDKVLAVNLKGPFRLTALVGTRMAAGAGGSIINVSSVGSIRPSGDIVPYAAAKAGLNAMTVAFAHAFGPKVRVNCIM